MKCLESLLLFNGDDIRVTVVDDGSTDGTAEYIDRKFPDVRILKGTGTLFWTGAVHFGIETVLAHAQAGDWVLLANNDIVFTKGCIDKLVEHALLQSRRAVVCSLSLDSKDADTVVKTGTIVRSWVLNITQHIYQGEKYSGLKNYDAVKADLLTGRCLLHPVEVFGEIGNYDKLRFPHYGGDDEFTARAKRAGYELLVVPESVVYLNTEMTGNRENIWRDGFTSLVPRFFGIRSSINIVTKWKFAVAVAPFYAIPSYYLIAILKSIYVYLRSK